MTAGDQEPVGLVGIGLMGGALARRLLGHGFRVLGFDTDPVKRARLVELGGDAAQSVAEISRRCRRVLVAVFDTGQVEAVLEGEGGLVNTPLCPPGPRLVLCASTCDPDRVEALAGRAAGHGVALIEAPVSGASEQVACGEGVGLLGGDRAAIDAAADILDAIYPRRFVIGAPGSAGRVKLAVNLILGLNRAALAEGLAFAERLGLDPRAFLEVARNSAAYSQVMDAKGEKMLTRDYAAQGKIVQTLKDVRMMQDLAAKAGQPLPLLRAHAELLEGCVRNGEGDWDNCAVAEEICRRGRDAAPVDERKR